MKEDVGTSKPKKERNKVMSSVLVRPFHIGVAPILLSAPPTEVQISILH